ncbi:MAG: hypothetical protein ACFHWZ_10670 [Phycisphaerales bacterium]
MEQFRRAQATIQKYLAMLTVSQKLLIASLVVVMLMTLFVVQQYASTTDYQEVAPARHPRNSGRLSPTCRRRGRSIGRSRARSWCPPRRSAGFSLR